jgi:hypothetical protein
MLVHADGVQPVKFGVPTFSINGIGDQRYAAV